MSNVERIDGEFKVVSEIESRLHKYVPGPFHWSAAQSSGPDDWCIAIGNGAACFTLDERARRMEDDFIRELATQILGYPPDSTQDLEARLKVAQEAMASNEHEIQHHREQKEYWFKIASGLEVRLAEARERDAAGDAR